MDRSHKFRELGFAAALLVLCALLLGLCAAALRPAQNSFGSTWQAYLAEPEDTMDVLYLGSSYAYCDFDPVEVYQESGLTGYVMAGSEQTMAITYWYLREALKTQSPSAVVIEPTGVFFQKYQSFTQTNLVPMPFSLNKLGAIFTAAEPDLRGGLLFDLYLYHDRWREVTPGEILSKFTPAAPDHKKGNTPVEGTPATLSDAPIRSELALSPEQYAENLRWLDKCLALCEERGIQVLLLMNPTYSQYVPQVYADLEAHVKSVSPGTRFLNWTDRFDALGLDPTVHLYDGGHLNHEGAILYSRHVGRLLREELGLTPRPQTPENTAAWDAATRR